MGLGKADVEFLRDVVRNCRPDGPLEYGDPRYVSFDSIPGGDGSSVRGIDLARQLATRVELADEVTTQLFAGFRGAGKSTELRRLKFLLEERGYDVILKEAEAFLDVTTPVEIGDFMLALAAAVEEGVTALVADATSRPDWFDRVCRFFRRLPIQPTEADTGVGVEISRASLKRGLKQDPVFRKKLQSQMAGLTSEFHQEFDAFLTEMLFWFKSKRPESKGVVFIFDGVDHIRGSFGSRNEVQRSVETLFSRFRDVLKLPGLHAVYTVPTYLPFLNPGLSSLYGMASIPLLPMIKQHRPEPDRRPDEVGVAALRKFVLKRVIEPERLLGGTWASALDEMIAASGGYLRDLLTIIRTVAETAYLNEAVPAPDTATRRAILNLADEYSRVVTPEDVEILSQVAGSFSINDVTADYRPRLADLFETHASMLYCNGKVWYDVHPLIIETVAKQAANADRISEWPERDHVYHTDGPGELYIESVVVERLEIRNLRCINEVAIDFDGASTLEGDWTCFVGINGSGKTTILQALCLILLGDRHATDLGRGRLGRMCRRDEEGTHDAEIVAHVRVGSALHRLGLRITPEGLVGANGGSNAANKTMREIWKLLESRLMLSYGATRNLSDYFDTRYKSLGAVMQRQMTLFDPLTQVASAETILSERSDEPLHELVRALVASVVEPEVEVVSEDGFMRFVVHGAKVGALDLPDGYRSSAAWLCDLAASWYSRAGKNISSLDPMQIVATVLIDEIDLHLHPSLQRILVPRLRRALPKVQWLVSTHSPLIVSSFDMAEIVLLDSSAESGVRKLDRQILGFSTNDVYRWLMDTPPSSEEAQRKIAEVTDADREEVRLLLEVSPDVGTEEARARLDRRRALLKNLKDIKP